MAMVKEKDWDIFCICAVCFSLEDNNHQSNATQHLLLTDWENLASAGMNVIKPTITH